MYKFFIILLLSLTIIFYSFANEKNLKGLSKDQYSKFLIEFQKTMGPIILKTYNKQLILKNEWESERVNAHATRDWYDNSVLVVNGAMARHPLMTKEVFFMVLCHELGHQFGGAPKQFRGRSQKRSWSSAEAQADYFATLKCFPHFNNLKLDDLKAPLPKRYADICKSDNECNIALSASESLTRIYAEIKKETMPVVGKKDSSVVRKTILKYPTSQCRLDTLVSGLKCHQKLILPLDPKDHTVNTCTREKLDKDFDEQGIRPNCWFNPNHY